MRALERDHLVALSFQRKMTKGTENKTQKRGLIRNMEINGPCAEKEIGVQRENSVNKPSGNGNMRSLGRNKR